MLRLGDILICKDGAGIGKVGIVAELPSQATINSSLLLIRPANSILPKYLYYCLSSPYFQQIVLSRLNGATTPHLYQRDITDFPVHFPCFTEQERIVAILDKAFGGIERASIKCGMALENTRDAFESYRDLLFADSAGGVGNRLDELVSFRNGVNFTKSSRGKTVAIVGVKDFQNRFSTPTEDLAYVTIDGDVNEEDVLRVNDLLTVRSNGNVDLIGRTMLVEECPQDALHSGFTIRTRIMTDDIWPRYLCHFMRSRITRRRLIDGGTGTNIKSLNQGALASLVCPFPSIARQRLLANELDQIADATERLQSVYKEKQSLLDALKRSLLHQAFSGQLREQTSKAVVIPFPIGLPNISSTDLHVGILAIAYAAHESARRASDFGHVKAEKIAHMVESFVGLDLGRTPVRDAAGPNDFPHLKKVEHRADRAGYLTFARQVSGGYRVTKKVGFDSLVIKTRAALGDRNPDLDRLLELMTPMSTRQAEIFATVYAAWNNLLMDGEPITDESIVRAAREDWHSDKLNIPRDKFFTAIEWIRTKNLCPEGKGKRVECKGPNH